MNTMCWPSEQKVFEEFEYKDYVFNHSEYLKIHCSKFLIRLLKPGDHIVLKVTCNQLEEYTPCIVKRITSNHIYALILKPLLRNTSTDFTICL